jgi:hypothetical protein
MKHLWLIVLVSLGLGLALVGPTLWRYRKEIKRTWGEALGFSRDDDARREIRSEDPPVQWRTAALLSIICIVIAILLGVAIASGGAVAWSVCGVCISGLVVLFNVVLLARIK